MATFKDKYGIGQVDYKKPIKAKDGTILYLIP